MKPIIWGILIFPKDLTINIPDDMTIAATNVMIMEMFEELQCTTDGAVGRNSVEISSTIQSLIKLKLILNLIKIN